MSLYKGNNLISGAIPNSANQSLSNLDSAGQDKFDAKVNKAGDTMTGDLIILSDNGHFAIKSSFDSTTTTAPSEFVNLGTLAMSDTNDNYTGYFQNSINTDNAVKVAIGARRIIGGAYKTAALTLKVDASGDASCTFPNTTCVDGQWVKASSASVISSSTSVNGSTALTYSIASIIPNDGYNYEVLFCCEGTTDSTSGHMVTLRISSDIAGDTDFCRAQTRASSAVVCGGNVTLPVSTSRKIYITRNNNWYGSVTNLWISAYRRIGANS